MHILFEQLENAGFLKKNQPNLQAISKVTRKQIRKLAEESAEITSAKDLSPEKSVFSHSASLSLGGGRYPCVGTACRLIRAQQLAQFAAFYSDRVYINNFITDYISHVEISRLDDMEVMRMHFFSDISVLASLRPMIEARKVIPITAPHYCAHCLLGGSFGEDADNRLKRTFKQLAQDYYKGIKLTLERTGDFYSLGIRGPERLLEHGEAFRFFPALPPGLRKMPALMRKLQAGKEVVLSDSIRKKMRQHYYLAAEVFGNLVFELAASQCLKTSFLTERDLDVDLLNTLTENDKSERRNQLLSKHLTCLVPFVDNLNLADILKLREREAEAFIVFRASLNKAIDEYKAEAGHLTERDAKAIYADILQPQLAALSTKVNSAGRVLRTDSRRSILGWSGAITVGLYSGFVPAGIAAAAKALGLTKVLAGITKGLMTKGDAEEGIRKENMFFLWKVQQVAAKRTANS
ncbi:MAG TPA: hypothetical protein VNL17_11480 [Verrucomicrobiae bacterium]|nr:hypothetical protein [Verrucomicrobiae bacterium]